VSHKWKDFLKADVLKISQNLQSNTPLLPVKKLNDSFRTVHDFSAVSDRHTLLAQTPPDATHFTVLDFSVPLNIESQGLFGFTSKDSSISTRDCHRDSNIILTYLIKY